MLINLKLFQIMNDCEIVNLAADVVAFCCNAVTYFSKNGTIVSVVDGRSEMCPEKTVPPLVLPSEVCDCTIWQILFFAALGVIAVIVLALVAVFKLVRCLRRAR